MKKLITISREYGSGGRIIGKILAEKLDVPFYDKEIIDIAVADSGFSRLRTVLPITLHQQ